ncbi:MAG TPA: choice-of-anchor J domain-containing protein [Chitinophagaceae bacterium]
MKKLYLLLTAFLLADLISYAQISLTSGVYSQNFNTLALSGTSSVLPAGWLFSETGTNANATYNSGTGSSNTGDTYSFGLSADPDRAFGGLLSGSLTPTIGAGFTNNTGSVIESLTISYTGEQWRLGTLARPDQIDFQYSLNATSLSSGTWVDVNQLDFTGPTTTGTVGLLNGNSAPNRTAINFTITGISIPNGSTFYIRWTDFNATSADDGLAVDDFSLDFGSAGPDVLPPTIATLTPPDNGTGISASSTASIVFSEPVQKGTSGTITVKDATDNTVQTIDITTAAVTVSGNTASFDLTLSTATAYYIQISAAAFEDLADNDFGGISDNSSWNFTTNSIINTLLNANFNNCTSSLSDGFTQFSATGTITWLCTTFGRDANNPPSGSAANGVQINGFDNGLQSNVTNEDWLISPALNLTATTYPLLSFWSRTKYNGDPLQLKISTDYPGSGDPRNFTWTDLNGRFPAQTTDVWTVSSNINLSSYKQPIVYIAFVYNSSDEDGARWTLDDVRIDNSSTPPPPSTTIGTTDIQFSYTASGATGDKSFIFTGNDITTDVSMTVNGSFLLSKDGNSFSSALNYTIAEANNIPKTVFVRFAPGQNGQNFSDSVIINTSGVTSKVYVKGSSIDPATTLEVVNWNIEWFGSTSNGPGNDAQQEQNVLTVMQNVNADLYALTEIVSEARLASVVNALPGYAYVISNYGSHTNPNSPSPIPLADAQKLAFVYKTSVFSNVSTTALLSLGINSLADVSSTSYNNWASGRFPYMLTADVTLDGVTKTVRFVLVHAKANTSPTTTSYNRRKAGADELYALFNSTYGTDNIIMLGDYNDDLDFTITDGINPPTTSYISFTGDASNYGFPTLPLSLAGKKSTVSYNDVIDHVIYSNEVAPFYMNSTAGILTDAASMVSNYASTTSDHYPVFSRYRFAAAGPLPVTLEYFSAQKQSKAVQLSWSTASETNSKEFIIERSGNGRDFSALKKVMAAGNSSQTNSYRVIDDKPLTGNNFYRLRMMDADGQSTLSRIIKVVFDKGILVTFSPNPAQNRLVINVLQANEPVTVQLIDAHGKTIRQRVSPAGTNQPVIMDVSALAKGLYILKMITPQTIQTEKVVIE